LVFRDYDSPLSNLHAPFVAKELTAYGVRNFYEPPEGDREPMQLAAAVCFPVGVNGSTTSQ
jgi:hypothetical protein